MSWLEAKLAPIHQDAVEAASKRQGVLTKPEGSLGRLETIAIQFAGWQGRAIPQLRKTGLRVFAADHGITAKGVSAFPADVTLQMIENFLRGGAAISVLAGSLEADFAVVNMGTFKPVPDRPGLKQYQLMPGTRDFSEQAAMGKDIAAQALQAGADEVDSVDCDVFIAGEMGIGNTSSAAAVIAALSGKSAADVVGRGTGVDDATLAHKQALVQQALDLHQLGPDKPLQILAAVGGLEIAAMCGAFLRCGQRGIPILLDGFIATAAAMAAAAFNPGITGWMIAGHQSAESAHTLALEALGLEPLLQLNMRLGEGSGAAVAASLLQSALALHAGMATFEEAGVADAK